MNKLIFVSLTLLFAQCTIDRTIEGVSQDDVLTLASFQHLNKQSILTIAHDQEPGERLQACLTFIGKEHGHPIKGQEVRFYHTSSGGNYQPLDPNDESTARLNGTAYTDSLGRIYVKTVLPGDYGSSADNRHIHTTVYGAKPEAYDIHFLQYTGFMGRRFSNKSDQHFLANLKRAEDGALVVLLTIEVKKKAHR